MPEPTVDRGDVETALEARRELGPDYEPQVIDAFVERIERRLEHREGTREGTREPAERRPIPVLLPLGSLGIGIGATGAALGPTNGSAGGILVAIIAWIAIAVVNAAYALRR
jgi:hypothetical protein